MAAAIETKLYVTNFPSSATRQQLQQFFSRFGRVQECAIMWNSYAFIHYATMEEAHRALDQSNGAMFLNRKLIVQLSTSRFRPQPKDSLNSMFQSSKRSMMMNGPSSSIDHNHLFGANINQQQSTPYTPTYGYDMMTLNGGLRLQSSSPNSENSNLFRSLSPATSNANNMRSTKTLKTDIGANGEIPKLYCTNLPDHCKVTDLQCLFSPFGHIVDCVILWDYYAFITYRTFVEAERALVGLNGYTWKDRRLIVEWSRASGRRQQRPILSPIKRNPDMSVTSASVNRSMTSVPHREIYGADTLNKSLNQHFALMSYENQYQQIFDDLTKSSNGIISPLSNDFMNNVYQPSDIVHLLEPLSTNHKLNENSYHDNRHTLPMSFGNAPPSCSTAAAAGAAALYQENIRSSLYNSFEPYENSFSNDDQSSLLYNNFSPLLTTTPDNSHYPMSYGHNLSWH